MNLPRPPKLTGRESAMTGRKLIYWLKAQGAKPLEEAESDRIEQEHLRLQKSGA